MTAAVGGKDHPGDANADQWQSAGRLSRTLRALT